jgi:hypothetical protein
MRLLRRDCQDFYIEVFYIERLSRTIRRNEPHRRETPLTYPVRHPCATTTALTRRRIQQSRDSLNVLAARYGINRKTVQKWRRRSDVHDVPRGRPRIRTSTVLTRDEEAIIVGFRTLSLLPLDDCLYALQERIPKLTRSSLHRCLQRHGLSGLPRTRRTRRGNTSSAMGCFRIDVGETITGDGIRRIVVAMDLGSRLFYAEQYRIGERQVALRFLEDLMDAIPYTIRSIVTAESAPFARSGAPRDQNRNALRDGSFHLMCARNQIDHGTVQQDQGWARMQLQRIAAGRGRVYGSAQQLQDDLRAFMFGYNFGKRLKCLEGHTPYQFVCRMWAAHPERFKRSPIHLPHAAAQGDSERAALSGNPRF